MKNNKTPLISIITPIYNAEKYLSETIKSVQAQTYTNWELLLINDSTPDNSKKIAESFMKKDTRIKWIDLSKNSGAAIARNTGMKKSKGKYVCFLDSDDLWKKEKLELQLQKTTENDWEFSFTGYEFADENGNPNGKIVKVPNTLTYEQALKNTVIWTSTVMLNMNKLNKQTVMMPNLRKGQDTATWWKILKTIKHAHGINEVTAYYRRHSNTLSSNKIKALKRTWNLYRKTEKLSLAKSAYNYFFYLVNTIKKRV